MQDAAGSQTNLLTTIDKRQNEGISTNNDIAKARIIRGAFSAPRAIAA